jgi:CheY-like chemotaxis protein
MVSPAYESKCVAIVDDDAPMREALMDPLDEGGCAARAFASGEEFLASGHAHECSCLIADIRMPGMTGLDLQARLSAEQKRSPSSLLLLTTTNAKSTRIHDPMQANTSLRSFVRGMVVGAIELQNSPTRLSSCPPQDGVCACGHGTWAHRSAGSISLHCRRLERSSTYDTNPSDLNPIWSNPLLERAEARARSSCLSCPNGVVSLPRAFHNVTILEVSHERRHRNRLDCQGTSIAQCVLRRFARSPARHRRRARRSHGVSPRVEHRERDAAA